MERSGGGERAVTAPSVRVGPAEPGALGPLARLTAAVTAWVTGGEPLGVFTTLGRHPRLFRAWLGLGATLMFRGELSRADRELVTLRVAWRCGSWYEWVQHVALARRAGLTAGEIGRVVAGPSAAGWGPRERLLLGAADELHDGRVVSDGTWQALSVELSERQLIELCLLVGHYEMLAVTLNSLGVEPEPSALARLSGVPAEAAAELRDRLAATRRA